MSSVLQILEDRGRITPQATALLAPERAALDYSSLYAHVVRTAASLRRRGIGRDDIVAVVLPNGPEMATAFLAVSAAAICAPLNPAYQYDEFAYYLADLPAKALVIGSLGDSPARDAARAAGIPVIEPRVGPGDAAGVFSLDGDTVGDDADIDAPNPDDIALVLHTSGTTSRPKIVPLTHANLCASAHHIAKTLELNSDDRCLNVMPLFHIHGLVGALLSSMRAGASIVCTPGFIAPSFFDWFAEYRPTWYTAVPTMHRAIVARATEHRATISDSALRFIRSSSAALPGPTLVALEETFGVPVIESYGMTEASHQMASNPLPPARRKPGTVGFAAGPEIAVLDAAGALLPPGARGEIAIRGPNVTSGYLRNPDANERAFTRDWLRTGDEGVLDDEGYLTVLGRLKEIINRGGEKISPLEVDDVLMSHPAVALAVTFAANDATLGEDVAAAVVLRPGSDVSELQLREFVAARLSHFKVPRRVVFVSSIPTGATGKLQRKGLAERLGVSFDAQTRAATEYVAPGSPVEEILASIWETVMRSQPPGMNDNFFLVGGDSILATQFVARVRDRLGVDLSLLSFFDSPTVAAFAAIVDETLSIEADATL